MSESFFPPSRFLVFAFEMRRDKNYDVYHFSIKKKKKKKKEEKLNYFRYKEVLQ